MKAITTRSGVAYEGPSIPTNPSPKKVVERETEETTDKDQNNFQGSTAHIPPPVNPILIPEPNVPKTLPKPNIPYPSRRNDQKSRDKASNQIEKIFQIFQDLRFEISFADALLLMPRFAPTIKNLLMNKEKLLELAKISLNENCSAMLLKKLPEKLGDPDKFLIPCDFPGMDHPLKHAKESIKMINFIEDSFGEVLRLKKSNHFLSSSLTSFETSDSLLEEFADELALLYPFPPGNEDVDVEAELREIELLFNRDPSTNFSPRITFDHNPERFTNEPSLVCLPPPGDECECNMPDSQTINFSTFSNPLFNDSTSSNDESSHEEVTYEMSFITYSNPLFNLDEEIISSKFNPIHNEVLDSIPKNDHFDAKSYLPESPLNHDTLTVFSPRNDPLHHEFAGEIITYHSRIAREHEEYINCFDQIDLFLATNDSMPPGIEDDDYDSEGDIRFLKKLLNNDSLLLPENESSNLDHFNDPSSPRPPPKPPDVEICFDFKPDTGVVTNKVVGDISEQYVLMPNLLPTQPILCPVFDLLLPFLSKNEDKVFNPGILISPLLSHRGKITSNFYKSPMMISGGDIPHLDVPFLHFYPP
ncbi:hypothetical protein Tco_0000189 [Tanacetum coccineum]